MIIVGLVLLGLCFGSFVNALVWRLREQSKPKSKRKAEDADLSISKGRSMCVHCGHTLTALDLLPVVSWLGLRGKCRYCKKPISWQYPVVEILTAVLFVASYVFWPETIEGLEIAVFGLWLASLVGLVALIVYDIKWMILPNKIIFPLYFAALAIVALAVIQDKDFQPLSAALGGVVVGGGIFYLLFNISKGKWIGGGDVKLGFLLGALLGDPVLGGIMLFLASFLGTIYILPLLSSGKISRSSRIPFGPFLIIAAIIIKLFGADIGDWYFDQFIDV